LFQHTKPLSADRREAGLFKFSENYARASVLHVGSFLFTNSTHTPDILMMFHSVYRLVSQSNPDQHYVGLTDNLDERLAKRNSGQVKHAPKYLPWQIDSAHAFRSREKGGGF